LFPCSFLKKKIKNFGVVFAGVWACSRCIYADPDFVKRKRKQMRASNSPSGRGRGRRRKHPPKIGPESQPSPLSTPDPADGIKSSPLNEKEEVEEEFDAKDSVKSKLVDDSKTPPVTIKISLPVSSETSRK